MSDSLQPHGPYSAWNSPGQNTGVGSLSLLQGIFPTQGLNPGLPHCRRTLYQMSHKESPRILEWVAFLFSRGSSHPGIEPRSPSLQADSLPVEPQGKSNAMVAIKCDYRCHSNKHGVPIKCPPMFHYYAPGLKGLQMGYMKGDCQ